VESKITSLIQDYLKDPSFLACTEQLHFQAGEIILFEHQKNRDLYFIESGKICIQRNERADIFLGSGVLLGELSFLQGVSRTATIIAFEETLCRQIHEVSFRKWLGVNPQKSAVFFQQLCIAIADRLRINIQREDVQLLFDQEAPILQQMEQKTLRLANRLRNCHLQAQAKKTEIEIKIRESLKKLQAQQEDTGLEISEELFILADNTEEMLFSPNLEQLSDTYHSFYHQAVRIFLELNDLLNRIREEEMRYDMARCAHDQFFPILKKSLLYCELQEAGFTESPNLMSEILLPKAIDSNEAAISAAISSLETPKAYREQFVWFQKQLRAQDYKNISSVMLINDQTGALFSLLFPLCASYPIKINFYADNPYIFGCVDVNLQNYGQIDYNRRRILNWTQDIIKGGLLEKEQDLIFLSSVLDYLNPEYAVQLLFSLRKALNDNGILFFSVLLPTQDTALFCDFLGWSTIRRNESQLDGLLKSAGYENIMIEKSEGALFVTARKN